MKGRGVTNAWLVLGLCIYKTLGACAGVVDIVGCAGSGWGRTPAYNMRGYA